MGQTATCNVKGDSDELREDFQPVLAHSLVFHGTFIVWFTFTSLISLIFRRQLFRLKKF